MKNPRFRTLLFVAICTSGVVFSSCKKKEVEPVTPTPTPTPTTPTVTEPFYAKIDGTEFVENDLTASVSSFTSTLEIKATDASGKYVRIKVPSNISPGTYDFADPDAGFRAGYYNDGNSTYGAPTSSGTLVIVSNTAPVIGTQGEIKGTFSFNAESYAFSSGSDSYSVTEGQFSVNY